MKDKTKEQWLQLCEQAAVEQDSEKLMRLVREINRMLEEKDQRLKQRSNLESGAKHGDVTSSETVPD